VTIVVRNPMPVVASDQVARREGNHMALRNIEERLDLHFDAEARLARYKSEGEFIVQIDLPYRKI
jgi:two-component system sensor histidine kinase AlgZ